MVLDFPTYRFGMELAFARNNERLEDAVLLMPPLSTPVIRVKSPMTWKSKKQALAAISSTRQPIGGKSRLLGSMRSESLLSVQKLIDIIK